MKEFSISVQTCGYEYYTVNAETFEDAVNMIKDGDGYLTTSEAEWSSDFYLDDEKEI